MTWGLVAKRGSWFAVLFLVSFAAAAGVLSVLTVSGEADELPPPPPWVQADGTVDESKLRLHLSDVSPLHDPDGNIVGWTYIPLVPDRDPNAKTILPKHVEEAIARGERVVYEERPGVTWIFEQGTQMIVRDDDRADPLHREPWQHPIFSTRAEAEQYAATQRPA